MKKLLLVFAHPDDESFCTGGTVAKYVKAGWHVDLLCATRGEAGQRGPYPKMSGEKLGVIREKELEAAAKILGISSVSFMGYRDGKLAEQNPGELEDLIFKHLKLVLPDVVITFDPTGFSNHPDHMKMYLSTTYAFQEYVTWLVQTYAASRLYKVPSEEWLHRIDVLRTKAMEPKLYYICMPESIATYAKKQKMIPTESFGKPWVGTPDKMITTVIDVKTVMHTKLAAILAHKTQMKDTDRFLGFEQNPLFNSEYYILRMHGKHEVFMGKNDHVTNGL